ncbi:hypothetical protein ACFQZE_06760 [Paenibacillus sp. GCM10027627]|uniref:hypothetical protein n=1 Tax=unclassified Paenibacillus TaxID=185978 RepID=UPI00363C5586
MNEFLKFFNEKRKQNGYTLNVYYSSIMDWCITIGYKKTHPQHGTDIVKVQNCDMELVFAKAHVQFKEWLLNNKGGY